MLGFEGAFGARSRGGRAVGLTRGLVEGDELVGTVADEIGAVHAAEGLAEEGPVRGVVVAEEGFVEAADLGGARNVDGLIG